VVNPYDVEQTANASTTPSTCGGGETVQDEASAPQHPGSEHLLVVDSFMRAATDKELRTSHPQGVHPRTP